jgi:cytochrome d ubiquinol oxidase subunit I
MDSLGIARWQFGITTVYHFLFVPITIGMAFFLALTETAWVRTRKPVYLRMVKFWGKIFLINFALGLVTGIVQEFQFGMNWSSYSRFVGDVFGAPLAMEALLAFFLESTFLGLWIFGWDKFSPRLHAACMWAVSIGTALSAYFIMAANSFMQNPVGITVDVERGRAEMNDIWAVLSQPLQLWAYSHVIAASILSGAVMFAGISAWFLMKQRDVDVFRPSVRLGLVGMLIGSLLVLVTGDLLAKAMTEVQPMKMAAAEALYETTDGASFSLITIGTLDGSQEVWSIRVPGVLSFMATGSTDGTVEGINNIQQRFEQQYGPGDYRPNIPVSYWSFRIMMGAGFVMILVSLVGLWLTRRGRLPKNKWVWRLAMISIAGPVIANSFGWIFTEMGRQPWTVVGLFKTEDSVSPSVSGAAVLTSLIIFTAVYGILAIIEVGLVIKFVKIGPPTEEEALASIERRPSGGGSAGDSDGGDGDSAGEPGEKPMAFAY